MQSELQVATELITGIREDTSTRASDRSVENLQEKNLIVKDQFKELGLKEDVLQAIFKAGVDHPSLIQVKAIPLIVQGKDVVIQSKTGTGKTLAYVAGVFNRITANRTPQALILAPTNVLTIQIGEVCAKVGNALGMETYVSTIAENRGINLAQNKINAEVIVGTVGSVAYNERMHNFDLATIQITVMDEFDQLLYENAAAVRILQRVGGQKVFFGATFNDHVRMLAKKHSNDLAVVHEEDIAVQRIKLFHMDVERQQKIDTVLALFSYLTIGQVIIFVGTKHMADRLHQALVADDHKAGLINGACTHEDRERSLQAFKDAQTKILVTTDVFSRGMDIPQVNLIINFDLPVHDGKINYDVYTHRIGRSGRFGQAGFVIDFVSSPEDYATVMSLVKQLKINSRKFALKSLQEAYFKLEEEN